MRILQPSRRTQRSNSEPGQAGKTFRGRKYQPKAAAQPDPSKPLEELAADKSSEDLFALPATDKQSGHNQALEPLAPLAPGKKRRRSELNAGASQSSSQSLELVVDPAKKEFNEVFARGVRLLAMREHSVKEITKKLLDKADKPEVVHAAVDELLEQKYLSDERFAESYVRARGNRGFGPVKIRAELKGKGVSNALIQDYLDEGAARWFEHARAQYQKKYGDVAIADYSAWTKRARFMQSRGFTSEHIQVTLPRIEYD